MSFFKKYPLILASISGIIALIMIILALTRKISFDLVFMVGGLALILAAILVVMNQVLKGKTSLQLFASKEADQQQLFQFLDGLRVNEHEKYGFIPNYDDWEIYDVKGGDKQKGQEYTNFFNIAIPDARTPKWHCFVFRKNNLKTFSYITFKKTDNDEKDHAKISDWFEKTSNRMADKPLLTIKVTRPVQPESEVPMETIEKPVTQPEKEEAE